MSFFLYNFAAQNKSFAGFIYAGPLYVEGLEGFITY